jgi:CHAT domain-containing protein
LCWPFSLALSVLLFWGEVAQQKPAADAVFQQIQRLRHTNGEMAREKAKQAFDGAKAAGYPKATEQRFRLLYADILIEQNLFSGVDSLLGFEPQNPEIGARLLAVIAYWEEKAQGREVIAARTFAKAMAAAHSVEDPCWKSEVFVHYAQVLVAAEERGAETPLADAKAETNNCPDKFWAAYRYLVEGNLYGTNHRYEQELTSSLAASNLSASHNFAQLIALTNGNVALAYFHLGDFDHALSLLRRAESWYPRETLDLAIDIGHRARVHHWRNEDAEAAGDYKRAIDILRRLKLERSPWYLRYVDELTTVLIDMGQLEAADHYNHIAINGAGQSSEQWALSTASLNAASILRSRHSYQASFDELRRLGKTLGRARDRDAETNWRLHSELAQTQVAMGRKKEADAEFRTAVATADAVRSGIDDDWNRMTFSVYVATLMSLYVDFEVGEGNQAKALQVVEAFRAERLAEKLHYTKAALPDAFLRIASARRAVILSYWITKKRSYVWVTTAREIKVFPLQNLETLEREIANHNLQIAGSRDLLTLPTLPTELYRKLVSPAESMIPPGSNLIIVPDGPLAALNFETLIPPARPPRFWLESVTVTVAPSLAVLHDSQASSHRSQQFLLVGGTIPPGGLKPLPGSEREVDDIKKLFPFVHILSLKGTSATPQGFLASKPGGFSLLHISAHAFANKESPLDSYIALTRDGSHPDGRLYAHDLMDLKLTSDLVTLSVCEGAGGKSLPGEGLIGLTWAILSSGARHVVAGLWKVSDPATADFMHTFYTYLSAYEGPAQALHDTKVAMANKQHSPPYYWAAFQLYTR